MSEKSAFEFSTPLIINC